VVGQRGLSGMRPDRRKLGVRRWKPFAFVVLVALAWWFYAAPANVANNLRSAVAQPASAGALVSARVDFARVNPQLSGELRRAVAGRLDSASFAQLLLHGSVPQQRKAAAAPLPPGVSALSQQTRLYLVRYKTLNRVMANFWDAYHFRQVILTLERRSVFHRWQVTKVVQFNMCAYDFDCASVPNPQAQQQKAPGQ